MKTLQQMLRELGRPEVAEFALLSDRLPCVKIGDRYEPIDELTRSTEDILAMLVVAGGSRFVEDLDTKPAQWSTRVESIGVVEVRALMRSGRVQARFTAARRPKATAGEGDRATAPQGGRPPGDERVAVAENDTAHHVPAKGGEPPALRTSMGGVEVRAPAGTGPVEVAPPPASLAPGSAANASDPLDVRLSSARELGASDLHIVAGRPMLVRIGGELTAHGVPMGESDVEQIVHRIVPERLRPVLEEHGSCDFAFERPQLGRFRVNVARQRTGYKACLRCIAPGVPTLATLGLPPEIERATHHHQGLVLVTGPTGHGKTSTLAAIVDIINRDTTHHVITVEDPVEYVHPRKRAMISQREVGSSTRSFATALKGSLREDPDVIVVGELRDTETVRMALAASETGHLVVGTMNTPSAAKTIDRVIDLFPPADQAQVRMTLAGGLHLIVGQRLLPAAGERGMVAAVELLPGSVALWSLIRDGKTFQIPSLQQRGRGVGILRLDESLADLVRVGRATRESALMYVESAEDFDAFLSGRRAGQPAAPEPAKRADAGGLLGKAGQIFGKRGA